MKKHLLLAGFIFLAAAAGTAQTKTPEWKEQTQFHGVMSRSFHPTEEGNFAPLKQKVDSLVMVAKLWNASVIPAGYKPKETKETLNKLVIRCTAVQSAVKENKPDSDLKKLITEAHETFHKIVEECTDKK